jgi:hypothetical protein
MDERFSKADRELFYRIGEVLHYMWDPIGAAYEPSARDEYSSYVPRCFSILKSCGNDPKNISVYLSEVREKNMGMPEDKSKDLAVAELIIEWGKTYSS